MAGSKRREAGAHGGFTFVELLVAMSLFAAVSFVVLQAFVAAMGHSGRSNERVAATALAVQIMEQIHASVNPYTMVNIGDLPRSPLPLPAPYAGVVNPAPYPFEVAVDVTQDSNLTVITALVDVYRPGDPAPLVTMMTMLDDQ
jgi:prepilin-type N-terminal cleavage/methylation domain-containing protein